VNLSNATNGTIGDSQGVDTIVNDDSQPTNSINSVSQAEGNSGTTPFHLHHHALESELPACHRAVTFDPGQTSKTVSVIADTTKEADETFLINTRQRDDPACEWILVEGYRHDSGTTISPPIEARDAVSSRVSNCFPRNFPDNYLHL